MEENLAALKITLSAEDIAEIDAIFSPDAPVGDRYAHMALTYHGNDSSGGH